MKLLIPKGLALWGAVQIAMSISSIHYSLTEPYYWVVFGHVLLDGTPITFNVILAMFTIIFVVGLFVKKRWAFCGCLSILLLTILMWISNMIFIEKETLWGLGWERQEDIVSIYRRSHIIGFLLWGGMIYWLWSYRSIFNLGKKAAV